MPWDNSPAARRRSNAVYDDPEYKRNRPLALKRAHHRCELRLDGCTTTAEQVDHKIPVSQGGTHQINNLRATCGNCHRRKTAQEGRGYRKPASNPNPPPRPVTRWR